MSFCSVAVMIILSALGESQTSPQKWAIKPGREWKAL